MLAIYIAIRYIVELQCHELRAKIVNEARDYVMSSSSTVTYTSVYTDSETGRVFWGADDELSDGGSPRVIIYGYDRLPMNPVRNKSVSTLKTIKNKQSRDTRNEDVKQKPEAKHKKVKP
ncbi:hypothetical protein Tco_1032151 [Tanacetum coccineum]|uniref:Uncharacterized protein n=1 Tax=Tanacetum coccineum TaxID=301880 RepID=A0ABQ5GBK1_9ASTR